MTKDAFYILISLKKYDILPRTKVAKVCARCGDFCKIHTGEFETFLIGPKGEKTKLKEKTEYERHKNE